MRKPRRYRALADIELQGRLCLRVAVYWVCCLLCVAMLLGFTVLLHGANQASEEWLQRFWHLFRWALLLSLLVLPMALVDCLIFSNKFAGPMLRLRRAMNRLAKGETVEAIQLRRGDFFHDLAQDFNQIAARLAQYESQENENAAEFAELEEQRSVEEDSHALASSSC